MKAVIRRTCKSVFSSQNLFVQLKKKSLRKLFICVSGCSTGKASKKSSLQLSGWHYLRYRDVNMTSPVTLHQLIKDNPFYAQKRIMEKKTGWGVSRIWFFPLNKQLGTSLNMSSEDPSVIPSAGIHVVQLESTDCWEFFRVYMEQQSPRAAARGCNLWAMQKN